MVPLKGYRPSNIFCTFFSESVRPFLPLPSRQAATEDTASPISPLRTDSRESGIWILWQKPPCYLRTQGPSQCGSSLMTEWFNGAACGIPRNVRVNFHFEGAMWPQWDACFSTVALNDVPDSPEHCCAETSISRVSLTGDAVDRGTYASVRPLGTFKENLPCAIIESFKMTGLFQV